MIILFFLFAIAITYLIGIPVTRSGFIFSQDEWEDMGVILGRLLAGIVVLLGIALFILIFFAFAKLLFSIYLVIS